VLRSVLITQLADTLHQNQVLFVPFWTCKVLAWPTTRLFGQSLHALGLISLFSSLSTRLPLLVATKIIPLGDVPMRTVPYAALAVGATDCGMKK
jgi:hypothetical protein